MESDDDVTIASAIFVIMEQKKKKVVNKRKKRRWWSVSLFKNRKRYNGNDLLNDNMSLEVSGKFENFCRMAPADFESLLQLIGPYITKQTTQMRRTISAKERFGLTLRFLASGDSYQSLSYLFKISPQLISSIVIEVCEALKNVLRDQVKVPTTSDEWKKISDLFEERWNFPNCVGAIDGKHIVIMSRLNSGSEYINYKGTFSIVLMALCDADYCVTYSNIGSQGRISDGGVFNNCSLYEALENKTLNLPTDEPLPMRENPVPYVIIGDNAFPLKEYLMVPYSGSHDRGTPERIYNYRLSRARRIIENVFGIMSAVF
ncbi:uncharacterized protein LOC126892027 [Diabrotica virgifera virgifera]|uniref:DDE Tnp4 domain-containing protein n=1 Tax=Diabrotica virgifera virgifera TaxID=50390 RepID=A0ABM5L4N0_DIAVI|nr:uncharacterized protein LOC126892027 [Diabrotica virgifera virgifera]